MSITVLNPTAQEGGGIQVQYDFSNEAYYANRDTASFLVQSLDPSTFSIFGDFQSNSTLSSSGVFYARFYFDLDSTKAGVFTLGSNVNGDTADVNANGFESFTVRDYAGRFDSAGFQLYEAVEEDYTPEFSIELSDVSDLSFDEDQVVDFGVLRLFNPLEGDARYDWSATFIDASSGQTVGTVGDIRSVSDIRSTSRIQWDLPNVDGDADLLVYYQPNFDGEFTTNGPGFSEERAIAFTILDTDGSGNPVSSPEPAPAPAPSAPAPSGGGGGGSTPAPTPVPVASSPFTEGDNTVSLTQGDDDVRGLGGNDALTGLGGNDVINGNKGDDLVSGNQGEDILLGGQGNDFVRGGKDADILYGDKGTDYLFGGMGNDDLIGGEGADVFHFCEGIDVIADFVVGTDSFNTYIATNITWSMTDNGALASYDQGSTLFAGVELETLV